MDLSTACSESLLTEVSFSSAMSSAPDSVLPLVDQILDPAAGTAKRLGAARALRAATPDTLRLGTRFPELCALLAESEHTQDDLLRELLPLFSELFDRTVPDPPAADIFNAGSEPDREHTLFHLNVGREELILFSVLSHLVPSMLAFESQASFAIHMLQRMNDVWAQLSADPNRSSAVAAQLARVLGASPDHRLVLARSDPAFIWLRSLVLDQIWSARSIS